MDEGDEEKDDADDVLQNLIIEMTPNEHTASELADMNSQSLEAEFNVMPKISGEIVQETVAIRDARSSTPPAIPVDLDTLLNEVLARTVYNFELEPTQTPTDNQPDERYLNLGFSQGSGM